MTYRRTSRCKARTKRSTASGSPLRAASAHDVIDASSCRSLLVHRGVDGSRAGETGVRVGLTTVYRALQGLERGAAPMSYATRWVNGSTGTGRPSSTATT
ncbi:hypothetical protein GCM10010398_13500 [Streptomyces fimbriatus]